MLLIRQHPECVTLEGLRHPLPDLRRLQNAGAPAVGNFQREELGEPASKILSFSWSGEVVSRAIDDTMIYICEYTHDNDALRLSCSDELRSRQGGALGVEFVKEVIFGVKDLRNV